MPVFEDATTYPCIVINQRVQTEAQNFLFAAMKRLGFDSLAGEIELIGEQLQQDALEGSNWILASSAKTKILAKVREIGTPLMEYCQQKIQFGIKTGFNEAFIIDRRTRNTLISNDTKSKEIIKPLIIGSDLQRYQINFSENYLIWTYIGVPIHRYSVVLDHLKQYQEKLERRSDKGDYWWELRACTYYDDFEKSKIVWPNLCDTPKFAFDDSKSFYVNAPAYILPEDDLYLLAILNSTILFYFMKNLCIERRGGFIEAKPMYISQLPIRCIDSGNPTEKAQHDKLVQLAKEMIDINKAKQTEQKRFLDWLQGQLHILPDKEGNAGIDALSGKTVIKNYPGDYQKGEVAADFADILKVLLKNKSRIRANLSDAVFVRSLEREHEKSLEMLLPIKERLAKTDWLIDQIVYKLYGLTEEEIDIVEGRK